MNKKYIILLSTVLTIAGFVLIAGTLLFNRPPQEENLTEVTGKYQAFTDNSMTVDGKTYTLAKYVTTSRFNTALLQTKIRVGDTVTLFIDETNPVGKGGIVMIQDEENVYLNFIDALQSAAVQQIIYCVLGAVMILCAVIFLVIFKIGIFRIREEDLM